MKTDRSIPSIVSPLNPCPLNPAPGFILALLLLPWGALAQQPKSAVALPERVAPGARELPAAIPPVTDAPALPAAPAELPKTPAKGNIMLNFQGTPIADVLSYLSEAAGFVIVQETPVTGTVNVVSRQPVNAEEAVDLLNTVLVEKGFTALRSGRILKIVSRKEAQKRDLPVRTGSDPDKIPQRDDMVTQILPLRYGEATKLVENLKPLLSETATINANEGSNSILLTDTQANIHRIAEIIRAIDTSVAGSSVLHVYALQFANAKEVASVVTQLFTTGSATAQNQRRGQGGAPGFGGFPGFGGYGGYGGGQPQGGAPQTGAPQNDARQAAARVIAVADDQSNSLIVSAPEDMLPSITEMIKKIDTTIADVTESRIFRLMHADAVETAALITSLFSDSATQNSQNSRQSGGFGYGFGFAQPQAQPQQSQRALQQSRVVAVGDPRTNSLLISAARDTMMQIAEMVGRLDATDAKKQHVYIHSLEHADADSVAAVLRGMLGGQGASSQTQSATSRLTNRSATGAAINPADASSTSRSAR